MASRKDYYDILGIRRGATEEEIEKAYQKLARTYQTAPLPGNRTADFRFKEILEAYEILSDKTRRERYDRLGVDFPLQESFWDEGPDEGDEDNSLEGFEDFWEQEFRGGTPGLFQVAEKGRDIHFTLEIDLVSAARGVTRKVQILKENPCPVCGGEGFLAAGPREVCGRCGGAGQIQVGLAPSAFALGCERCGGTGRIFLQPCKTCSGKGRVQQSAWVSISVPPGVDDRCRLYLCRMGHEGKNGGPRGDLVAEIRVKKHPIWERRGEDLYLELPLAFWEAALGAEVEVPSLEGKIKVKVPPGIQGGEEIRIPQEGVPRLAGDGRGDLVLCPQIWVPRIVDKESRELLEGLRHRFPAHPAGRERVQRKLERDP
ncbi:MAG: DnaJ domain-containing protein [Syntrophaceae bacterium]|nr:DnaJ domain-containing protein [Syntrophaceae bacterium]